MMSPGLFGPYKQLCAANHNVTILLFGDELSKNIQDINEATRMGKVTNNQGRKHSLQKSIGG